MSGLSELLEALSNLFRPVIEFVIWIFPVKVYRLHEGELGVILTLGKVRRARPQRGPGITLCGPCEEMHTTQALGGYVETSEQTIADKSGALFRAHASAEYCIEDVRRAILETESIEDIIEGHLMNCIREHAKTVAADDLLDSVKLTDKLRTLLNRRIKQHGVRANSIMLPVLSPHEVSAAVEGLSSIASGLVNNPPPGWAANVQPRRA